MCIHVCYVSVGETHMLWIKFDPYSTCRSSNIDDLKNPCHWVKSHHCTPKPIHHAEIAMLSVAVCLGNLPLQVKVAHIVQMPVNLGKQNVKEAAALFCRHNVLIGVDILLPTL